MEFDHVEERICDDLSVTLWKLRLISRYEHVSMLRISEQHVFNYNRIKCDH